MRLIATPVLGLALLLSAPGLSAAPAAPVLADAPEFSQEQAFLLPAPVMAAQTFYVDVRGSLVVEPDGSVGEVDLQMPGDVEQDYRAWLMKQRFEPVEIDGRIVRAKAFFQLDAVATTIPGTRRVELGVAELTFVDPPKNADGDAASEFFVSMKAPRYPERQAIRNLGAEIVLMLQLDAEGRVIRAGVASATLAAREARSTSQASRDIEAFASQTLRAAKQWILRSDAGGDSRTVLLPVRFTPPGIDPDGWVPAIPMQVQPLSWMSENDRVVSLTASGNKPSSRFRLLDDPRGAQVN